MVRSTIRVVGESFSSQVTALDEIRTCPHDDDTAGCACRKSLTPLANDRWLHVASTYDGSGAAAGIRLYVGGVRVDDDTNVNGVFTAMNPASLPTTLGRAGNDAYVFSGSISVVRVYDRALSREELLQNCLAQEGRFTATPRTACAAP